MAQGTPRKSSEKNHYTLSVDNSEVQREDRRSALWANIAPTMSVASRQLVNFRKPSGVNSRLAHWHPQEPTLRWFRSFVQLAAASTPAREIEILRTVGDTSLGNPVKVTVEWPSTLDTTDEAYVISPGKLHQEADLDYLYAAEEMGFIATALELTSVRTVVELGAGFGRTAHTFLRFVPTIESYIIVDLEETLELSSAYLRQVLTDQDFAKLRFHTVSEMDEIESGLDLVIQIDGFQEMDDETIDWYYANLVPRGAFLYVCNPVGKYLPETAGLSAVDPALLDTVMTLGRSQNIIDPWNEETLYPVRHGHVEAYRPKDYTVLASEPSRLRPFYQHTVYETSSAK